jgi:alkylation response protein AidB-like acyl-CoA dehydrogenase
MVTCMDPTYPTEGGVFREKIQAFLGEHLPVNWHGIGALTGEQATIFTTQWRAVLSENNLLGLSWPTQYGGP